MFIIERLIDDHNEAIERWESARDSRREYALTHPHPNHKLKVIGCALAICVSLTLIVLLLVGLASEVKIEDKSKTAAVKSGKNCNGFNKDDHVSIQYGDYKGNSGTIVGGCEVNQEYQVKLDDEQYANISGDGTYEPIKVSGNVISVDNKYNLAIIDMPEGKKTE